MGIAGERGLYDLVPAGTAEIKAEREANRNLWFLLARATGVKISVIKWYVFEYIARFTLI